MKILSFRKALLALGLAVTAGVLLLGVNVVFGYPAISPPGDTISPTFTNVHIEDVIDSADTGPLQVGSNLQVGTAAIPKNVFSFGTIEGISLKAENNITATNGGIRTIMGNIQADIGNISAPGGTISGNALDIANNADVGGTISGQDLDIADDGLIGGNLTIGDGSLFGGDLSVQSDVSVGFNLDVVNRITTGEIQVAEMLSALDATINNLSTSIISSGGNIRIADALEFIGTGSDKNIYGAGYVDAQNFKAVTTQDVGPSNYGAINVTEGDINSPRIGIDANEISTYGTSLTLNRDGNNVYVGKSNLNNSTFQVYGTVLANKVGTFNAERGTYYAIAAQSFGATSKACPTGTYIVGCSFRSAADTGGGQTSYITPVYAYKSGNTCYVKGYNNASSTTKYIRAEAVCHYPSTP